MRQRIAATALRIIKTPDDDSKGRVEPEDGLSPLSGIVPLGRIPNGTILHRRRAATWTSTTEAGKCSLAPGSAAAKPRLLVTLPPGTFSRKASALGDPNRTNLGVDRLAHEKI